MRVFGPQREATGGDGLADAGSSECSQRQDADDNAGLLRRIPVRVASFAVVLVLIAISPACSVLELPVAGHRRLSQSTDMITATFDDDPTIESKVNGNYDQIHQDVIGQVQATLAKNGIAFPPGSASTSDDSTHGVSIASAEAAEHDAVDGAGDVTDVEEIGLWVAATVSVVIMLCGCIGVYFFLHRKKEQKRAAALTRAPAPVESTTSVVTGPLSLALPPGACAPSEVQTSTTKASRVGSMDIYVSSTDGFRKGDRINVTSGFERNETKVVKAVRTASMLHAASLQLHTGLFYAHPEGAHVAKIQAYVSAEATPLRVDSGPASPRADDE